MDYDEYTRGGRPGAGGSRDEGGRKAGDAESGAGEAGSRTRKEEHRMSGDDLVRKVKELIREGNVRRITIRNDEGRTLLEIPLTLGVVGAALAPTLAGVGAVAALVTRCSIVVERAEEEDQAP